MKKIAHVFAFTLCGLLLAQSDRATISGTATDPTGAAAPGVVVTAVDLSTNVKTVTRTSHDGVYTIPFRVLGTYRVSAEMQGFKRAVKTNVVLNSDSLNRVVWGPGANVSAANFGKISGQGNSPRIMQVGLKINY